MQDHISFKELDIDDVISGESVMSLQTQHSITMYKKIQLMKGSLQ